MKVRQSDNVEIVGLCIGTNGGPRAPLLRWPQKDAVDVAHVLSGEHGTIPSVTYLLEPTVAQVRAALATLQNRRPLVFVLWISGHGSPLGPLFADGVMPFQVLGQLVKAIGARHSLLGLDICHAGGYLVKTGGLGDVIIGGVRPEYLDVLAVATPSAHVLCSVGPDRLAGEGIGVDNGHMTAAFFEAVSIGRGDRAGLITDGTLVADVRRISRRRWNQDPHVAGITANFPVIFDQSEVAGGAAIIGKDTFGGTFTVNAHVSGRRGVPTRFAATLLNRNGRTLTRFENRFVPREDDELASASFDVPLHAVERDPASLAHSFSAGFVPVTWHVAVEDFRGRQLDACHGAIFLAPRRHAA